jgi:hypothetical protein
MPLFEKQHIKHEKHLCSIVESGTTLSEYKKLIINPKYVCRQCGRSANKSESLCDPTDL